MKSIKPQSEKSPVTDPELSLLQYKLAREACKLIILMILITSIGTGIIYLIVEQPF